MKRRLLRLAAPSPHRTGPLAAGLRGDSCLPRQSGRPRQEQILSCGSRSCHGRNRCCGTNPRCRTSQDGGWPPLEPGLLLHRACTLCRCVPSFALSEQYGSSSSVLPQRTPRSSVSIGSISSASTARNSLLVTHQRVELMLGRCPTASAWPAPGRAAHPTARQRPGNVLGSSVVLLGTRHEDLPTPSGLLVRTFISRAEHSAAACTSEAEEQRRGVSQPLEPRL